jgi:hypothetical protein
MRLMTWLCGAMMIAGGSMLSVPTSVQAASGQWQAADGDWIWLERELVVGNWVLDAGMGIAAGMLASINETLRVIFAALLALIDPDPACGRLGVILCTPPTLFLDRGGVLGAAVQQLWELFRPIAGALVGLLLLVRIGRIIVDGPADLAREARSLTLHGSAAIVGIYAGESFIALALDALNEVHRALLPAESLERLIWQRPAVAELSIGLELTTLTLLIVVGILLTRALMRIVVLALLIGVAPLAAALLIDRATAPRFGSWLARLGDTLLQQTVWVGCLGVGAACFGAATRAPADDVSGQLGALAASAAIFALALGGEAWLPGGAASARIGALVRQNWPARRITNDRGALAHRGISLPGVIAAAATRPDGDPRRSAAAVRQRAMVPVPAAPPPPPRRRPPPPPARGVVTSA